jgi:hypothetical protein
MPVKLSRFSEGLFEFIPIDENGTACYEAIYQDRKITTIPLSRINTVSPQEYDRIKQTFIAQLKVAVPLHFFQIISRKGQGMAGFWTDRQDLSIEGYLQGYEGLSYRLSQNGKVLATRITFDAFVDMAIAHRCPPYYYVRQLLSSEILTENADKWRHPTNFELRHIVGSSSLTGVTNEFAANLIGISANNFRKYIASEKAANKAKMSFASWHLLLVRLKIRGDY